jgi:hypothetical protein
MVKSRKMRWTGHVAPMRIIGMHKDIDGKARRKGRLRHR